MTFAEQEFQLAMMAIDSDCVVTSDPSAGIAPIGVTATGAVGRRHHRYGPIVGAVCPPGTTAVAYPFDVSVDYPDSTFDSRVAVVVFRDQPPLVIGSHGQRLHPLTRAVPVIDLGRRALGMPTPEPTELPIHLLDRVWLDRVLTAVLDSDLGFSPTWRVLLALHPALPQLCSPEILSSVRRRFRSTWSDIRQLVASGHIEWHGMAPEVADWLDDGSFARWCLADTPDPQPIMSDLADLVDPSALRRLNDALWSIPQLISPSVCSPSMDLPADIDVSGNGGKL